MSKRIFLFVYPFQSNIWFLSLIGNLIKLTYLKPIQLKFFIPYSLFKQLIIFSNIGFIIVKEVYLRLSYKTLSLLIVTLSVLSVL